MTRQVVKDGDTTNNNNAQNNDAQTDNAQATPLHQAVNKLNVPETEYDEKLFSLITPYLADFTRDDEYYYTPLVFLELRSIKSVLSANLAPRSGVDPLADLRASQLAVQDALKKHLDEFFELKKTHMTKQKDAYEAANTLHSEAMRALSQTKEDTENQAATEALNETRQRHRNKITEAVRGSENCQAELDALDGLKKEVGAAIASGQQPSKDATRLLAELRRFIQPKIDAAKLPQTAVEWESLVFAILVAALQNRSLVVPVVALTTLQQSIKECIKRNEKRSQLASLQSAMVQHAEANFSLVSEKLSQTAKDAALALKEKEQAEKAKAEALQASQQATSKMSEITQEKDDVNSKYLLALKEKTQIVEESSVKVSLALQEKIKADEKVAEALKLQQQAKLEESTAKDLVKKLAKENKKLTTANAELQDEIEKMSQQAKSVAGTVRYVKSATPATNSDPVNDKNRMLEFWGIKRADLISEISIEIRKQEEAVLKGREVNERKAVISKLTDIIIRLAEKAITPRAADQELRAITLAGKGLLLYTYLARYEVGQVGLMQQQFKPVSEEVCFEEAIDPVLAPGCYDRDLNQYEFHNRLAMLFSDKGPHSLLPYNKEAAEKHVAAGRSVIVEKRKALAELIKLHEFPVPANAPASMKNLGKEEIVRRKEVLVKKQQEMNGDWNILVDKRKTLAADQGEARLRGRATEKVVLSSPRKRGEQKDGRKTESLPPMRFRITAG